MNTVYLLIGGNIGDRKSAIRNATEAIGQQCGTITAMSSLYETAAWGVEDQAPFLNRALKIETILSAESLLRCLLTIEESMGRKRDLKYGPRIIDIDILLMNDEVITTGKLRVPHPELENRRFALQCLNDIAEEKVHPVLKKTIQQLLKECPDHLAVKKMEEE